MIEAELRSQLVSFGSSFFNRGYSVGSAGNLSARLPDGSVLATPTNSSLGRLSSSRLAKVSITGEQISGDKMSKEIPFHLALYRQRPDCQAVVHLHSTYLTALSCRLDLDPEDVIRPFTPYYVMKIGRMPLIPYFSPGSPELADALEQKACDADAFLLTNHGSVVIGASLTEVVNIVEELEETAKLFFLLQNSPVRYLDDDELKKLRKHF